MLLSCAKTPSYTSILLIKITKQFTLSVGTYSIDESNAKINAAVLRQRKDCKRRLKLVIQENYQSLLSIVVFSLSLVYLATLLKKLA